MEKPPVKAAIEPDDDDVPRSAPLKKAKGKGDTASADLPPSGLGSDGGTRGMMLAGSHPAAVVLNGMATIEQQIKAMSRYVPQILQIAAPFIDDMKAATAAGLADLVSGGMGSTSLGPGAGPGGMVPGGPAAGPPAGMPMPMAPPPPPMAM